MYKEVPLYSALHIRFSFNLEFVFNLMQVVDAKRIGVRSAPHLTPPPHHISPHLDTAPHLTTLPSTASHLALQNCTEACPATCFGGTCDDWYDDVWVGEDATTWTCAQNEADGCDCSGCSCEAEANDGDQSSGMSSQNIQNFGSRLEISCVREFWFLGSKCDKILDLLYWV